MDQPHEQAYSPMNHQKCQALEQKNIQGIKSFQHSIHLTPHLSKVQAKQYYWKCINQV